MEGDPEHVEYWPVDCVETVLGHCQTVNLITLQPIKP